MRITEEKLQELIEPIRELRQLALKELQNNADKYYPTDLQRILKEDRFLARFLLFKKSNVNNAAAMIKTALAWRKEFGVNEISKDSIPPVYFSTNAVVLYKIESKEDIVVVIKGKDYKKMPDMENFTKKFVIYWLELMDKHSDSGQITIVFSFKDCGLSNLDLEMIKFLITVFTSYYPLCLSYILIYELPWLLNAAWRLVKSWLPEEAIELVKLVDKDSIFEYVDKCQLPTELGGINDNLAISEIPENSKIVIPNNVEQTNNDLLVHINPSDQLKFCFPTKLISSTVIISISNISKSCVAYKIKTTSRQRYRAWPFLGLIQPGDRVDINAQLINDAVCQENDKFLILITKVKSNIKSAQLEKIWHVSSEIMEYKLKCIMISQIYRKEADKPVNEDFENIKARLEYLENITISQRKQTVVLYFCCIILLFDFLLNHSKLILSYIDSLLFS